jgi:hypothetical protein
VVLGLEEPQVLAAQGGGLIAGEVLHRAVGVNDLPFARAGVADHDAFRGGSR